MSKPRLSLIILSFGQHEVTIACLESLTRLSSKLDSIIVCDNNSPEQSRQAIIAWSQKQYDEKYIEVLEQGFTEQPTWQAKFIFIQNGSNIGFAQGNNPGIRYALASGSDFIWFLNNDTTVHPAALGHLLHCASTKLTDITGSTVVSDNDKKTIQYAGGSSYNPATTIFKAAIGGASLEEALNLKNPPHIDYVYGASFFVRKEVFEKCGLLNEDYFLFNEEIDLCTRAKRAGFNISWCRNSLVYHKGSWTINQAGSGDRGKVSFANYHENLSTLIFSKRFYPYLLPFIMPFRFFGKIAVLTKRRELYLITPLLHAYRDFFLGRNQRENYRG